MKVTYKTGFNMRLTLIHIIKITIVIISLLLVQPASAETKDIYLVFYATANGKSGHVGIAVDNYKVIVKDAFDENNNRIAVYDTIKNGALSYYDLWPKTDDFNAFNVDKNVPAQYFKLPSASWENDITITSLIKTGLPHEEFYPVDGLLQITSSVKEDLEIKKYIAALINKNQDFNVRDFNCADFVELIIEKQCHCDIKADESIVLKRSTTPNRIYQEVSKLKNIKIIKDAREKAKGAFTSERLLKRNQ